MNQEKKQQNKPRGRPWPAGLSGNPHGRPKGALNKLSLAVLAVNESTRLKPEPTPSPFPVKFDPWRDHEHTMHKIDGRWRRTVEQEGRIFDRETGFLLT